MKAALICEGSTDLVLLQYYLERVHGWEYIEKQSYRNYDKGLLTKFATDADVKWLKHSSGNLLCIIAAGGSSSIVPKLAAVLDVNLNEQHYPFERIAIVSDRDEVGTEQAFISDLRQCAVLNNIVLNNLPANNTWVQAVYSGPFAEQRELELLLLLVPHETEGAIETFLLNAISDDSLQNDGDQVDHRVINQCNDFIDNIQTCGKYLTKRREKTKAKFDTYFVVVSPAEAFGMRRDILRSVKWENYTEIQKGFSALARLALA